MYLFLLFVDDDMEGSYVATVSNVRQDLSEWQQRHATLVLTIIKVILFGSLFWLGILECLARKKWKLEYVTSC